MRRPFPCLIALSILATPLAAQAMTVSVNHSARLNIPGVANSVIIGNPSIADVTVVDSHTVYVLGRGEGSTDIIVLDRAGRPLFKDDVKVGGSEHTVMLFRGATGTSIACDPACGEAGSLTAAPKSDPSAASLAQTAAAQFSAAVANAAQTGASQAGAGQTGIGSGAQTGSSTVASASSPRP